MSGVKKFQHVPNEIQAIQFTGDNINEIWDAFGAGGIYGPTEDSPEILLSTISGFDLRVKAGDWIIPDVTLPDTFSSLSDEDMTATYLPINEAAPRNNLNVSWPRVMPEGAPITKKGLKEAWSEFMTPLQEAGRNQEPNIKTLLAVLRHVYGAMPDDKE